MQILTTRAGQSYLIKATVSNWVGSASSQTLTVTAAPLNFTVNDVHVFLSGPSQVDCAYDAALEVATNAFVTMCQTVTSLRYTWSKVYYYYNY